MLWGTPRTRTAPRTCGWGLMWQARWGVVNATVYCMGNVSDPKRGLYDLEYYLKFVCQLEAQGIHALAIKGEHSIYHCVIVCEACLLAEIYL